MLFQIYGAFSAYKLLGWLMAFLGLVILNEIGRRTKFGGILIFVAIPLALTIYFIAIYAAAAKGAEWALTNPTYVHMNSWFHYAKLYAADCGCIGFMMLKYKWGIGAKEWFKPFPFIIVAINILIAVCSDFESAIKGAMSVDGWWLSSEGVWLYGGWWNVLNGIAGIINIFCMTGWWGIYSSKGRQDMLWPDMTWMFILAYDVWNFEYTSTFRPTPGIVVLLFFLLDLRGRCLNKGGWIRTVLTPSLSGACLSRSSRHSGLLKFSVLPSVYGDTLRCSRLHGCKHPSDHRSSAGSGRYRSCFYRYQRRCLLLSSSSAPSSSRETRTRTRSGWVPKTTKKQWLVPSKDSYLTFLFGNKSFERIKEI